jgi:hypothetical protein
VVYSARGTTRLPFLEGGDLPFKALGDRLRRSPPPLDYVFVVAYRRSGSTLVQGLLNALPRTLVRGENYLYLLWLYRAWADVRRAQGEYGHLSARRGTRSAFHGIEEVNLDDFVASARELAVKQLLGTTPRRDVDRLGFKEVLWHRIEPGETEDFFGWFDQVFPGARYLLTRRDREVAVSSGFWRKLDPADAMRAIERAEEIQQHLLESRPDRTLAVQYERLTSDDRAESRAELRAMAEFVLGTCDRDLIASMRQTMRKGHGPKPFGKSRTEERTGGISSAAG